MNDFFTATQGVYMKKKLDSKELGKYGLTYYNSLFMVIPSFLFAFSLGEIDRVSKTVNIVFFFHLPLSGYDDVC